MFRILLQCIGAIGVALIVVVTLYPEGLESPLGSSVVIYEREVDQTASIAATAQATPEQETSVPRQTLTQPVPEQPVATSVTPSMPSVENTANNKGIINTAVSPYDYPPLTNDVLNTLARGALVNILCSTSNNIVRPISGSGVIIDPRGVILTNAHVAQYVLLASRPEVDLQCSVRIGSPAKARWGVATLYFPDAWLEEHAADITKSRPLGTGEHDYALLIITQSLDEEPRPVSFPFLPTDTRSNIADIGDSVLLAAYPAEFSGGSNATRGFFSASSAVGAIKQLLTFNENTVDLYSLGSTVLAQSGSSGGAVLNAWGYLIGIISTTSEGQTTAERDLHALTISYINRDFIHDTGQELEEFLSKDMIAEAVRFMEFKAPVLSQLLIDELTSQ